MQEDMVLKTIGVLGTITGVGAVLYRLVVQPIWEVHKEQSEPSHVIYHRETPEKSEFSHVDDNKDSPTPDPPKNH